MTDLIKEGDYVIAKTDSVLRVVQVWKDRPLFLGKRKIRIGSSVGHPYGSFFDVKSDGNIVIQNSALTHKFSLPISEDIEKKDNRSLIGSDTSQKLSTSDIEAFKADGIPGEEIVKIIVENSSSFKEKSFYSQEKYVKKKQLKYMNVIQVSKPNARFLSETFYSYSPQKICNLRIDSLSQMLSFCNVMSGGKYLVVDSVLGLVTASVLERIGSQGNVIQLFMAPSPIAMYLQAVNALNLSPEHLQKHLYSLDVNRILSLLNSTGNSSCNDDESCLKSDGTESLEQGSATNNGKLLKKAIFEKAKELLLQKNMDALLVAIKHHPSCVLPLLDFLSYSRPFAIYCMHQEPLIECYSLLKRRGDVIMLNISETWMRKYQVMPERTHPEYGMSSNGGYLLTGMKVEKK